MGKTENESSINHAIFSWMPFHKVIKGTMKKKRKYFYCPEKVPIGSPWFPSYYPFIFGHPKRTTTAKIKG